MTSSSVGIERLPSTTRVQKCGRLSPAEPADTHSPTNPISNVTRKRSSPFTVRKVPTGSRRNQKRGPESSCHWVASVLVSIV
jgi:hypothetical protein